MATGRYLSFCCVRVLEKLLLQPASDLTCEAGWLQSSAGALACVKADRILTDQSHHALISPRWTFSCLFKRRNELFKLLRRFGGLREAAARLQACNSVLTRAHAVLCQPPRLMAAETSDRSKQAALAPALPPDALLIYEL